MVSVCGIVIIVVLTCFNSLILTCLKIFPVWNNFIKNTFFSVNYKVKFDLKMYRFCQNENFQNLLVLIKNTQISNIKTLKINLIARNVQNDIFACNFLNNGPILMNFFLFESS